MTAKGGDGATMSNAAGAHGAVRFHLRRDHHVAITFHQNEPSARQVAIRFGMSNIVVARRKRETVIESSPFIPQYED